MIINYLISLITNLIDNVNDILLLYLSNKYKLTEHLCENNDENNLKHKKNKKKNKKYNKNNIMNNKEMNYKWLFAPGTNSFIPQLARYSNYTYYTKNDKMCKIINNRCIKTIGKNYEIIKFPEIDITTREKYYLIDKFLEFKAFYKNILTDTYHNGFHHFPDIKKYNLGQDEDIKCVNLSYEKLIENTDDENIIIYGVSRGSCALINWFSKCKPKNIKGIILEGTPSSMDDLLENSNTFISQLFYILMKNILPKISDYKPNGINALDNILELPKDIPILFITSKQDQIVPYQCSLKLYNKLLQNGYNNVDICILEKSGHNGYINDDICDRKKYYEAVKKLYKKIDLDIHKLD